MTRVAYVTDAVGMGGGETSLLYHLEACIASGLIDPVLICPEGDLATTARQRRVEVCTLEICALRYGVRGIIFDFLPKILSLYRTIRSLRIQVVHAESVIALCHLLPELLIMSPPLFMTWHGFGNVNNRLAAWLFRKNQFKVFAVSRSAAESAVSLVPSDRVVHLPLVVHPSFLESPPRGREEMLNELHLPAFRPVILQLARFQEIKGQLTLLSAYVQARDAGRLRDAILLFVGGVLPGSDQAASDYFERVKQAAKASKYASDIFFVSFQSDVVSVLKLASLLVIPSRYESFGMVAIEAMAAGIPVLATKSGGLTDIISQGNDGILIDVNNTAEFCEQMDRLISDSALARTLVQNAQQTVRKRYMPRTRVETLLSYYKERL